MTVPGVLLGAATIASAQPRVTEFIADPSGTDNDREWVEIYNPGDTAIDLTNYAVGDGTDSANTSTGEGMGVFPSGTFIDPQEVFVIAANANGFFGVHNFLPDFEFGNNTSALGNHPDVPDLTQKPDWGSPAGSLAIANGGDDVAIVDPGGAFVDGGNHGSVQTFYPGAAALGSNQSYERVNANVDTNTVNDWVVRTTGTATPGTVTVPEPAGASLLAAVGTALMRRRRKFKNLVSG